MSMALLKVWKAAVASGAEAEEAVEWRTTSGWDEKVPWVLM